MAARFGPNDLLECYRRGVFPMAEARDDDRLFLVDPERRGIMPLEAFHVPRRLARFVRADPFQITIDTSFAAVMRCCAQPAPGREDTWINGPIFELYAALHGQGYAHSVEVWDRHHELVGGLYGVALGGAFFGESMFSSARDASKVALVHLAARLIWGGFALLDAQFWTAHLSQFGAVEIPRAAFKARLERALALDADFAAMPEKLSGAQLLQSITQIS
jgi:leucyl/phenylalanyl-tRNA--protein transferase